MWSVASRVGWKIVAGDARIASVIHRPGDDEHEPLVVDSEAEHDTLEVLMVLGQVHFDRLHE